MSNRPHTFPVLIAAVLLLVAIAPLPYGYYQFMRWAVCGIGIYLAVSAYRWKRAWATWIFVAIAILFNPIIPIYLSREVWLPIDCICSLLFGFSPLYLKKPTNTKN